MTTNETCPHCGAEIQTAGDEYYLCWTNIKYPWHRDECCYERQLATQAAEIERLKKDAYWKEDQE